MQIPNFSALLTNSLHIKQLKQIHGLIVVNGLNHLEPILVRQIIVSSGCFHQTHVTRYVKTILNHTQHQDISALGFAIRFLCQHGQFLDAVIFYLQLQSSGVFPNTYALSSILKAYGKINCKEGGISVHCQAHKYGLASIVYVQTALLDFYGKMGDIKTAHRVFDEMNDRNVVSWNAIVSGYVKFGDLETALSVFDRMPERDIVSWNAILLGYARAGKMDQAYVLFKEMPERSASSWNVMIRGYIDCGKIELARGFFDAMPHRNSISYITMISAYSKCGDVESAERIFYEEQKKDQLLYNAMIACYAQNGRPKEALHLFDEMLQPILNIQPDKMTLVSAISACSQLGDSFMGSRIVSYMGEVGIRMDDYLSTALIDMHAKCGSIDKAIELFYRLEKKDVVAYSAIILGCGINGRGQDAIKLFEDMMHSNMAPNSATITGILSAYSHAGLVEEGYNCFELMQKYEIIPCVDHYAIMVDLLGKAGRLEEAYELIKKMPMQPHSGVWGALLLACSVHNNLELGEIAAAKCFELEPDSTGYYSLLSKIYASSGKWEEAKRLRGAIEERGFNKVPGCSWTKPAEA